MVVKQGSGFSVVGQEIMSKAEYLSRFNHMTRDCGYSPGQAASELKAMLNPRQLNETDVTMAQVEDYVYTYAGPGDLVYIDGIVFYVLGQAKA
jgi:hypothetical protein